MNAKRCTEETRDGGRARTRRTPPPHTLRIARRPAKGPSPCGPQASGDISAIIEGVATGFLDSLRFMGEGTLPLILAIRPELSTQDIAEDDPEFVRRERLQSAAERRFFKAIEPALRSALRHVLTVASRDIRHSDGEAR
jgi:hypothetical protein